MATARQHDINGWYEIKGNPLSKVGVFEYLGSSIGAKHPDRIYKVYRPESELSSPETIESFKLLPWITEHLMLGEGETPAEKKGVEGVVGEDVFYEEGYLKGNIKVFSQHLARLIETGMKELSLGYKCQYEFTPGVYDDQHYDAVQTSIRGNHLATVEEGRMGKEVSVMDKAVVTFDSREFQMMQKKAKSPQKKAVVKKPVVEAMDEEEMDQEGGMTLSDMSMMIKQLMPLIKEVESMKAMMNGGEEESEMTLEQEEDGEMMEEGMEEEMDMEEESMDMEEDGEDEEEDPDKGKGKGMDSLKSKVISLEKAMARMKKKSRGMDSNIIRSINQRDDLARKLSNFVGVFDHKQKTPQQVAQYGVKKLGIPCQGGYEIPALEAYLHNRRAPQMLVHSTGTGTDSTDTNPVDTLFQSEV